jgi:hypothetical protein
MTEACDFFARKQIAPLAVPASINIFFYFRYDSEFSSLHKCKQENSCLPVLPVLRFRIFAKSVIAKKLYFSEAA